MEEYERLKQIDLFYRERIKKIKRNEIELPLPFLEGGKIVLHIIPNKALEIDAYYDLSKFCNDRNFIKTLKENRNIIIYVHNGLMIYNIESRGCIGYVLISGNGIIEVIDCYFLNMVADRAVPIYSLDEAIKNRVSEYLIVLKTLGVELPVYMFLNILDVKDFRIDARPGIFDGKIHSFYLKELNFQRLKIEDFDISVSVLLKAWFNRLWNAGGYPKSDHYDEAGDWIKR